MTHGTVEITLQNKCSFPDLLLFIPSCKKPTVSDKLQKRPYSDTSFCKFGLDLKSQAYFSPRCLATKINPTCNSSNGH